jgi:hypothetical protein
MHTITPVGIDSHHCGKKVIGSATYQNVDFPNDEITDMLTFLLVIVLVWLSKGTL